MAIDAMIARLAVAKRVVLLKRIVDTLPLLPVVAAAPKAASVRQF
jgi:hypothetical protein